MTTEIQNVSKVIFFNPELSEDVVNSYDSVHEVVSDICHMIRDIQNELKETKNDYFKAKALEEEISYLDNFRIQLIG